LPLQRGKLGARSRQHEFGYEAALCHIGGLKPTVLRGPYDTLVWHLFSSLILTLHVLVVILSVRMAAGTSTKSSLFHKWTRDTRDHPILDTRSVDAQLRHELAGLGGGTSFYKDICTHRG
jgi:outer membrane protein insertion porin family